MTKLHELLAAEKTPNAAWSQVFHDTIAKFRKANHFFEGHSKSLKMIDESATNEATEDQAREEKAVATTVFDTLEYALGVYATAEDLQYRKNKTNQSASATVVFEGKDILIDMPVDELLGLEARLSRIREIIMEVPTLDATKHWQNASGMGKYVHELVHPEETTKTEKTVVPVVMHEGNEKHPPQVHIVNRDVVVGKFTTLKRSGAATSEQKANAIKRIDALIVAIKSARMRANETVAVEDRIAGGIVELILEPFK